MPWVLVVVLALLVVFLLLGRRPKRPAQTLKQRAAAIRAEYESPARSRQDRNLARWLPIMEGLPIVDRAATPHLHAPVYDRVADEYELPCAHSSYEADHSQLFIGMPFGPVTQAELRQTLDNFSDRSPEAAAFVDGGDCAYLIYADTLIEPGAKVQRYVRIGPDAYMANGWRSGMSRGAGPDDPPFFVRDVSARPEVWARHMQGLAARWTANSNYAYALRQCAHR